MAGSIITFRTDQQMDRLTIYWAVGSTEVENCNVLVGPAQLQWDFSDCSNYLTWIDSVFWSENGESSLDHWRNFSNCSNIFIVRNLDRTNALALSYQETWQSTWENGQNWSKQIIIEWSRCGTCMISLPNREHHLGQSKYAIWSWSDRSN